MADSEDQLATLAKIVSFNMRTRWGDDGEHHWSKRIPLVTSFLDSEDPDVVATQELDAEMLADLAASAPRLRMTGRPRDGARGEGAFLLYDPARVRLVSSRTFWLTESPDEVSSLPGSVFPRVATAALFVKDESRFRIVSVHLDYAEASVRLKQTEILLSVLAEEERKDPLPTVVLGDFNAPPGEPLHALFRKAKPPFLSVYGDGEPPATFHAFGKAAETIDYLYLRGCTAASWRVASCPVPGKYYSDHDPVVAFVRFRKHA
jgi:endonuclease/exonuclease/phosphatase family metal-dependent hydrolase